MYRNRAAARWMGAGILSGAFPAFLPRPCRAPRRCRSGRMRIHFYWIPGRSDQLRSVPACNLPITCQALPRRASDRCARCRCRLPSGRWKGQGLTSSGAPTGAPGLPMCRGDKLSEHEQGRTAPEIFRRVRRFSFIQFHICADKLRPRGSAPRAARLWGFSGVLGVNRQFDG